MKLWKKISIICGVILIIIVTVCCAIMLVQSQNNILALTQQQAQDKQRALASSFSEMANYYIDKSSSETVQYSLVNYCFSRFADDSSVLIEGGETHYSQLTIEPQKYLAIENNSQESSMYSGEINGRQILIVGSSVNVRNTVYDIYVVEDITPVYENNTKMMWQFVLVGLAGIIIGLAFIVFLVRRSMRPLAELKDTASHIAHGGYDKRAEIRTTDEIGELADDFNRMAQAVEHHINELTETAERQRLFIGGVTHEFKTPLTTLILNADTLQNAYMDEDERMAALSYIERQCKWLERLVQKLLRLITLGQKIEKRSVSVSDLFERVRESTDETLRSRNIILETDCRTQTLDMDADLMQSVLINLVDNAAKASSPGQTVTLSAYDNILEVKDNGAGIPQEELSRITEPFYMVDKSRSKKLGGVGLGLALVKEITGAHGAQLVIDSALSVGTTVRIIFSR